MVEEDGRPGAAALQFGHVDALTDAPTVFLRRAHPAPPCCSDSTHYSKTLANTSGVPGFARETRDAIGFSRSVHRVSSHSQGETQ